MDWRRVRRRFEERFSAERMAKKYVEIYRMLTERPPRKMPPCTSCRASAHRCDRLAQVAT
jgi:hypothetical protein